MDREIYAEIGEAIAAGERRVLATVSQAVGSTPRKPGARMLLRPDGSFVGTIGGGCGEAEVWADAMETMADGEPPRRRRRPDGARRRRRQDLRRRARGLRRAHHRLARPRPHP